MFIGKWNKSVIITYLSVCFGVAAMVLANSGHTDYAMMCLLFAGIGDLFDGPVARKCKRDESEKRFGIELDSLADVFNFGAVPIVIFVGMGNTAWYHVVLYCAYGICQIARLAYFNITLEEENVNCPVKCYKGVPVTCSAFIFPVLYLLQTVMPDVAFSTMICLSMLIMAFLHVLNVKIPKPHGIAIWAFSALGVVVIVLYHLIDFTVI